MEYTVYSNFDIDKHAEHFINYLEIVIDENGEIHYAVPSHQMFMENIIKRKIGNADFQKLIICEEAIRDYLPFLCKQTNCVPVWNEFYFGQPNEKQLETLRQLKAKKYNHCRLSLYQGEIYG